MLVLASLIFGMLRVHMQCKWCAVLTAVLAVTTSFCGMQGNYYREEVTNSYLAYCLCLGNKTLIAVFVWGITTYMLLTSLRSS